MKGLEYNCKYCVLDANNMIYYSRTTVVVGFGTNAIVANRDAVANKLSTAITVSLIGIIL